MIEVFENKFNVELFNSEALKIIKKIEFFKNHMLRCKKQSDIIKLTCLIIVNLIYLCLICENISEQIQMMINSLTKSN